MLRRSVALAVLAAMLAAAPALGAQLVGNPMTINVGALGQLQAFRAGEPNGIFYPPLSENGDAGLFLALTADSGTVFGFPVTSSPTLTNYTPVSQQPTSGSGTAADPLTQVTTYTGGSQAEITQTTTYVNGSQQFNVRWDVKNVSGGALNFKAMVAADFFFEGSDRGTGIFTVGPPRFIGGTNADTGRSGGFAEVGDGSPAWSHYQALEFGGDPNQVWGKIEASAGSSGGTFDDTVVGESVDNAGAVEWDQFATGPGLASNATTTFALLMRSALPSALQLNPPNAGAPQGVPITVTATAADTFGTPYAGRTLRFQITGANLLQGTSTLNASGQGTIVDPGINAGADTIVAYVDFNNNGVREPVEPQASSLATFIDSIAPGCRVSVSGDRPGGGGAGKPLVITVNCDEPAAVTVSTTLTPLPARRATGSRVRAIRLRKVTRTVAPGKRFAFRLKVPKRVARKYAGKKLRATITVTAKDLTGNVKRKKTRRIVKLRALPRSRGNAR